MAKALTLYFVHSTKSDYNNLLYLPVLRSNMLSHHKIIFPQSVENREIYFKDLMDKADLIVMELTNIDITLSIEVKQAVMSKKPILALAQNGVGYDQKLLKYIKNVVGYNNGDELRECVEKFVDAYKDKINEGIVDPTVVLGVLK